MSWRTTAILLAFVAALALALLFVQRMQAPAPSAEQQRIWYFSGEEPRRVTLHGDGGSVTFSREEERWHWSEQPQLRLDLDRWSGVPLLFLGPRPARSIVSPDGSLAEFGLEPPRLRIDMEWSDGRRVELLVGRPTLDGEKVFVKRADRGEIHLLDVNWARVMEQLLAAPPVLAAPATHRGDG